MAEKQTQKSIFRCLFSKQNKKLPVKRDGGASRDLKSQDLSVEEDEDTEVNSGYSARYTRTHTVSTVKKK